MILTYKYRIKDRTARKELRRCAEAVNQVWNWCVAQQRNIEMRYRAGAPKRKWATHFGLARECAGVGASIGLHQQSVGLVCKQFVSNRNRVRRSPRFRASRGPKRSLGWIPFQAQSRQTDRNSVVYLGRRYRFWEGGRPLPETAKGGCFVEDARGRWYVCFNVEIGEGKSSGTTQIGIDLGLKHLATCSDGEKIPALQHFRAREISLAKAQRAGNTPRVRAIHARIANARRDHLHKASAKIARANSLIVVGNVSAVRLKQTVMAKSVSDAGWSMFRHMLRYKASRHGACYVEADERFTSQVCSSCGSIPASGPKGMGALGIRSWECSDCGASHDRDVNAAKNILMVALSVQRRGDESRLLLAG